MCDCIEQLKEKVTEMSGDPKPSGPFETSLTIDRKTNKMGTCKVVHIAHHTKKKNGDLTKSRKKCPVKLTYCPFCGEKYQ